MRIIAEDAGGTSSGGIATSMGNGKGNGKDNGKDNGTGFARGGIGEESSPNRIMRRTPPKKKKPGVAEAKADPTGSWVVYKGSKVVRFKTHAGAKAYAEKNGGQVASSEYYHGKIKPSKVKEGWFSSTPPEPKKQNSAQLAYDARKAAEQKARDEKKAQAAADEADAAARDERTMQVIDAITHSRRFR